MKWAHYIHCHPNFETPTMRHFLENIEAMIQQPWKVLKDDPTSTVVVISIDARYVVVKRSNTKSLCHGFRRLFMCSRARRNWHNAKKLDKAGIKTFQPIAFLEERNGPLKGRSYFIYEYIQGVNAQHYFKKGAPWQAHWKEVAERITVLFHALAAHMIAHRDLNLGNILIVNKEPWLIDLDGMRSHIFYHHAEHEKRRFIKNCKAVPSISPQVLLLFELLLG